MASLETTEVNKIPDVPLTHLLKQLGRKVQTKIRPRSRKQKSRPKPSNKPSRVSTFSESAVRDAPRRRPTIEQKTENAPCPIPSAAPPRPESASTTSRPLNGSLWAQAYIQAKEDPSFVKLLESYNEFLVSRYGLTKQESAELLESLVSPTGHEQNTPIQKIAEKSLNNLESNLLAFHIGNQKIVVRERVKKILDFLTTFKSVIGAAAAAEPSASLAWTGVMAALPFLENIFKQDEIAAVGFERISFVLVRYALLEKDLLRERPEGSKEPSSEQSRVIQNIRERIVMVYVTVYEYQIRIILQYAHGKPRRVIGDMFLLNDWKKMTSDINEKDLEIDRAVNAATHSSLRDELRRIDGSISRTMSTILDSQKEISAKLDISILDRIPYVENAVFNSEVVDKQGKCLPGTQRNALDTIQTWAESPDGEPIFWLAGMAGTGKSTIALTVANCLHDRKQFFSREQGLDDRTFLGATFFLSHEDPDRNTVKYVFPTIARTMATRFPDLGEHISRSIYRDTEIGSARLVEQMQSLLSEPLAIISKTCLVPVRLIIIIDSIDECEKSSEAEQLLRLLSSLGKFHPMDVRVLVVSRPEKYISHILDDPKLRVKIFTLEKIAPQIECPDPDDITKFLKHEVASITKRREFARDWIKNEQMSQLIERADGLFIYAATTCRFLDMTDDDEIQGLRLGKLIEGTTDYGTPDARLDEIYRKVLTFPIRDMSQDEKDLLFTRYRCILGLVALAFEPLSVVAIGRLAKREGVRKTLMDFRSILEVPVDDQSPVSFFHMSFRDFLFSKERSGTDFAIEIAKTHRSLFQNCLAILDESLHHDMCDLGHPGVFASEIPKRRVHEYIPQHVRYACLYWSDHLFKLSSLESASSHLNDQGEVYGFLSTKFLYWLEVLSLLGEYQRSIPIIKNLQSLATKSPELSSFLHDAYRFVLSNHSTISQAPLQTYSSALIFSPDKSIVRARFLNLIPSWITQYSSWRDDWGSELMALNGKSWRFAISKDGNTLVSSGPGGTTKAVDIATGLQIASFQYPSDPLGVAICRDGTTIASVLSDHTISLRSLTNEEETILTGNPETAIDPVTSPTDDVLASISQDYIITLWDLKTSEVIRQITCGKEGEYGYNPLVFSPCGQMLVAGCGEAPVGGILVWNWKAQKQRAVLKHEAEVKAIAISPDGQRVVSSDTGRSLKVWAMTTGVTQRETEMEGSVFSIAWHPTELSILALGVAGCSIQLCNIESAPPQVIKHIDLPGTVTVPIRGIAFTGDLSILASADRHGCLRLWDTEISSPATSARRMIESLHFLSGNKALAVSEGDAEILDLRTGSRQMFLTNLRTVACSPAQDLFAFCSKDDTIQFWDSTLTRLITSFPRFSDVFFPKGCARVVLMSRNKILVLEYHTLDTQLLIELPGDWVPWPGPIFAKQGIGIVTKGDGGDTNKMWLFRWDNGERVPGFSHSVVSNNEDRLPLQRTVFMSPDCRVMIYETTDKNNDICFVAVNLEADYKTKILSLDEKISTSPAFSLEGNRMIMGTKSGTLMMWDMNTMTLAKQLCTEASRIDNVHFCTEERITFEATSDQESEKQLWDIENQKVLRKWKVDGRTRSYLLDAESDRHHFTLKEGWLPSPIGDSSASCRTLAERDQYLLDVEGGWLWQGNERLLRLPPEFDSHWRVKRYEFTSNTEVTWPVKAVSTDSIILGLDSGDVVTFTFDRAMMLFIK